MNLRRMRLPLVGVVVLALVALFFIASKMRLPAPQIASAAGQPAPDFNLTSASGEPFTLSRQRGKRVVLVFYRGYW